MVRIDIRYEGDLHTTATHGPSGTQLSTDAPKDNEGRGESFSPTDLLATSLGACMLSIMGIYARRKGLPLEGATVEVTKHMDNEPIRRVGALDLVFAMPPRLAPAERRALENAAHSCPVHKSLHPDIKIATTFRYPD